MKKLLILAAAALFAVSCTDKEQFTTASDVTPIYTTLSYDTASKFASNAANRSKIFNVEGKYIKLTVAWDENAGFLLTASLWDGDDDDNQLDAQIAKLEGDDYSTIADVDITNLPEDDQYKPFAALPETDVEISAGRTTASAKPAYIVRYVDTEIEGGDAIYFAVVIPYIQCDETITSKEVVTTPFGDKEVVLSSTFAESIAVYYKPFDNGQWVK